MILIYKGNDSNPAPMDGTMVKEENKSSLRPVRSRRYTRRTLIVGHRPQKKLFTPEIKRYLKDWLIRRRENPYPNREEKKHLANQTGLTYIQICNWFANWRRKLKNVNIDRNQQTWGHLIRTYNDRAQGNVEHFSICSEDSIWSEPNLDQNSLGREGSEMYMEQGSPETGHEYNPEDSDESDLSPREKLQFFDNNTDRKNNNETLDTDNKNISSPLLLSKWLESAARFQPSETNYLWWGSEKRRRSDSKNHKITVNETSRHDRDEVEAAVALTALATASNRLTAL